MYENALPHVSSDNNAVHLSLVYARMSPGNSLVYERTDVLSFDIDFIKAMLLAGRHWKVVDMLLCVKTTNITLYSLVKMNV